MGYLARLEELQILLTKEGVFDLDAKLLMGYKINWNQLTQHEDGVTSTEAFCVGMRRQKGKQNFFLDLAFVLADGINVVVMTDLDALCMVPEAGQENEVLSCCKADEFERIRTIINAAYDEANRQASGKHLRLVPKPQTE